MVILLVLMPGFNDQLCAQRFQNLSDEYPISLSEVLFQDKDGYLWIGTTDGLYRFDGYNMEGYLHDPEDLNSLAGNNINAISQDSFGRLWIGLRNFGVDVVSVNNDSIGHLCLKLDDMCLEKFSANAICPDGRDLIWIATYLGLFKVSLNDSIRLQSHFIHTEDDDLSLSHDHVFKLLKDSRGRLWVGGRKGINLYDPENDSFKNHRVNRTFPSFPVIDIEEDGEGRIFVTTRFGDKRIFFFNEDTGEFELFAGFEGPRFREFRIAFDQQNDLWINSRGKGAYYYDRELDSLAFYSRNEAGAHGYKNFYGVDVLTDTYGNIWFSGEYLLKMPATNKYIDHIKSSQDMVRTILRKDSILWYGGNKPVEHHWKSGEHTLFLPDSVPFDIRITRRWTDQSVRGILSLDEDRIAMIFHRSVVIWNIMNNDYEQYPLDIGGPFVEAILSPDRQQIWICSKQGRPLIFDLVSREYLKLESLLPIVSPRCIELDENGDYWIGTAGRGLYKYLALEDTVIHYDSAFLGFTITASTINDIEYDQNGHLYLSTNVGLYGLDTYSDTLLKMNGKELLLKSNSPSILIENEERIWVGGKKSISILDWKRNDITSISQHHGLTNNIYMARATYKDDSGMFYFGGDQGIDIIDPKRIGKNDVPPDIDLEEVLVNGEKVQLLNTTEGNTYLQLGHEANSIDIEFIGIHLTAPQSNMYAYKIPEIGNKWINLDTRRSISLAGLSPGEYTLLVRAANLDNVWSNPQRLIHIDIAQPWWKTYWFIGGLVVILALVLYVIYSYRIREIEKREKLETDFSKRIAEVESKALRAQMNPHFLFNSINAVNSLISSGEKEKASVYLSRFGKLIRLVLSNSEKPMVRLQEEMEALELYLQLEQLRFQNFEFHFEIDPEIDLGFVELPPLILQPYVENAIWHGLLHKTEGKRRVIIRVIDLNDGIQLEVEDNGIGRKRAEQHKTKGSARKKGMGMRLTRDRLNVLQKLHGGKVSIDIVDLVDDFGLSSGTKVVLQIWY